MWSVPQPLEEGTWFGLGIRSGQSAASAGQTAGQQPEHLPPRAEATPGPREVVEALAVQGSWTPH